jgi:hypothetical protein
MVLVETVATHPDRQEIEVARSLEAVPRQRHRPPEVRLRSGTAVSFGQPHRSQDMCQSRATSCPAVVLIPGWLLS